MNVVNKKSIFLWRKKMRKIIFITLLIFFAFFLFSQIKNPDRPLRGKWDFQVKNEWEIENAGNDVFGDIQNICSANDGRIYILDSKNFKIYIFNKEGEFISSFGRKGEGPGEIRNFRSGEQLFVVDNTIIYADRGRIHYFSLDGTYKKTCIVPTQLKPRTFVSEDAFISAPAYVIDQKNKSAKIKLYNIKDQTENTIADYRPFEKAKDTKESGGQRVTIGIVISNVTPLMYVKYRSSKVFYGMSDSYKINIVDLKGKKRDGFSVENRKQKNVSKKFKEELTKELGDIPQDMVKNILDGLPDKASFFQNIVIDRNGLIYVFVSDPDKTSLQALDIFSPEGKYLYSSEFKVKEGLSIYNIHLKDDLLVIAKEDEEGEFKVAKYWIKLPSL
jgi:hypothetical protein